MTVNVHALTVIMLDGQVIHFQAGRQESMQKVITA